MAKPIIRTRSEIQGLRAIAVLLVVLYHTDTIFHSGFVGVDVFFVISGFVISQSINRELERENTFSITRFYGRRIRRLIPGLSVMLTAVLLLSNWFSTISSRVQTVRTGLFATFSLSNIFLYRFRPDGYFEVAEKTNALLHTWSLSIEEQFYLAFPIFVAIVVIISAIREWEPQKLLAVVLSVCALMSLAISTYVCLNGIQDIASPFSKILGSSTLDSRFAFYIPLTRAWEFIAGILIAQPIQKHRTSIFTKNLGLIGILIIFVSALLFENIKSFPGLAALLPVIGTIFVLRFAAPENMAGTLLSSRWLIWIGDRSYGWYLWHWPFIQFAKPFWPDSRIALLTAATLALIPTALSFRFIENGFRYREVWRTKKKMSLLVGVALIIPTIAGLTNRSLMSELDPHMDATMGCEYGDINKIVVNGACWIKHKDSHGSAILIGDSHAGQLTEAFIPASNSLGLDAIIAVKGNSPFLFKPWDMDSTRSSFPALLLERIGQIRPKVVVVAQSKYDQNAPSGVRWSDEFLPVLQFLESLNIPVVIVSASVNVGTNPQKCSVAQVLFSACDADAMFSTEDLEIGRSERINEELIAVRKVKNTILMDTLPILCPKASCATRRGGKWWWRDDAHISIIASTALTPLMEESMLKAIALYE